MQRPWHVRQLAGSRPQRRPAPLEVPTLGVVADQGQRFGVREVGVTPSTRSSSWSWRSPPPTGHGPTRLPPRRSSEWESLPDVTSERRRLLLALLATVAVLAPLGWMWQASHVPDTYSAMDMGVVDHGRGAELAAHEDQRPPDAPARSPRRRPVAGRGGGDGQSVGGRLA
jgi:hypothetical protein